MKYKRYVHLICYCVLLLELWSVSAQTVHSVKGSGSDSCNIVNVNFGESKPNVESDVPVNVKSGPPGKRGAAGPVGPKGTKGGKGDRGDRGPSINPRVLKNEVLHALSARSCNELTDNHGVTTTGYYWMRRNHLSSNVGSFSYCDFRVYSGVSTCGELIAKYNVSIYGYYRLGNVRGDGFHYCPDVHTCHHLAERDGITESGFYQIGTPGNQYKVYCNLFSGIAITEVWHDSMEKKKASDCENPGCYSHRPQYFAEMDQIESIINHSRSCQQFIEFECLNAVLLFHPHAPRGYWLSRNGETMRYWGGASSMRPGYCACGETGTCVSKDKKCNCDRNGPPITRDNGYLTDKTRLPVSEMRFGDMGDTSETGWHTLGKLECVGEGHQLDWSEESG